MADNPIADYQSALEAFDSAVGKAEEMVMSINHSTHKLSRWRDISVSDGKTKFPVSIQESINPREWPSLDDLAQTLSAYHTALHEVGNAFRRIPDNQRGAVKPPPDR